jgi:hypothetical protein
MKLNGELLENKWVTRSGSASGVGVPAVAFFTSFSPPLFPSISIFIAALSGAVIFLWNPGADKPDQTRRSIVKKSKRFLFSSIFLLIVYILLWTFTTVTNPIATDTHLQIGFGLFDWTLTDAARDWLNDKPTLTVIEMIKYEAAFTQDRITILWQTWSVYVAGTLIIVLYFLAFFIWAIAFALLKKPRSSEIKKNSSDLRSSKNS